MNVAEVLVKALEHEHVEYMFGIPGEENLYIMKALKESGKIKVVIVRHEQGAAFMADVYGRLTGRAGVCFSTLGPGATNLITGVADANGDGAPLVAITAQVSTDKMPLTSHQYLDLETLFQPITRRTKMIVAPGSTNEIVRLAFKYAEGRHPGATHICIPQDVSSMEVPDTHQSGTAPDNPRRAYSCRRACGKGTHGVRRKAAYSGCQHDDGKGCYPL